MTRFLERTKIIEPELRWGKIRREFKRHHNLKEQKDSWSFEIIKRTNKEYANWIHVQLGFEDLKEIILPKHNHRNSDADLIPKEGLTLYETSLNLKANENKFSKLIPECLERIKFFRDKPLGIIYLAEGVLSIDVYKDVKYSENKLVHLDGLHRLLSLFYPEERPSIAVDCYVAYNPQKK